jgi:hypothetical protein
MAVFSGSTSLSATSTPYNIAGDIVSFSVVNKTGGAITINVSILYGSTNINIIPQNKSLASGEAYIYTGEPIRLQPERMIYVLVSGSADYYFSIV